MSIVQQINEGLQALGFSQSLAAQLDQFIAFLGVLLVAYLADTVCRKILLKVVSRLVKQTKATWDDIVFDRKVMVHLSRMVAPILIYIRFLWHFPTQSRQRWRLSYVSVSSLLL